MPERMVVACSASDNLPRRAKPTGQISPGTSEGE